MKTLLLLTLAASSVGHVFAESAIPKPFNRERYEETVVESPFALATPQVIDVKTEEVLNVLTNLYVTGITQKDGKDYVMVRDVGEDRSFKLVGNEKNPNGIFVQKVNWGDRYDVVSVVVGHGTDTKEITFKKEERGVAGQKQPYMMQNMIQQQGGPGNRFNNRPQPQAQAVPIVPTGSTPTNATRNNLTPGAPRPGGTQTINGGVPRPGGQGFRNNNGANPQTPNVGPQRAQRDRGPIRNGR